MVDNRCITRCEIWRPDEIPRFVQRNLSVDGQADAGPRLVEGQTERDERTEVRDFSIRKTEDEGRVVGARAELNESGGVVIFVEA